MTTIEWVRNDDGSEGLSWNALRAVRIDETGKRRSCNHCEHVNEACRFCYAEGLNKRLGGLPFKPGHRKDYTFEIDERKLLEPLRRKKPTRIFVESMSDAFGEWWPDHFIYKLYAVMALCPQHTFINLSKRPERRRKFLDDPQTYNCIDATMNDLAPTHWCKRELQDYGDLPLKNVIEGTSVSNQPEADEFLPPLLRTKAALFALSAEPLLGPIDLTNVAPPDTGYGGKAAGINALSKYNRILRGVLDWVIVGGESGPKARPMHPQWARDIRDQCQAAGVAFFFKQWGAFCPMRNGGSANHGVVEDRSSGGFSTTAWPDGTIGNGHKDERGGYGISLGRETKKAAGRLLDGVQHDGFPRTSA